ncbi:hypothetical protein B0H19DRAFT_1109730 [Mycena capillaripes]|nr:hypothetical protein B0H19DRAFT_1109730 [Mycena capillaripes]
MPQNPRLRTSIHLARKSSCMLDIDTPPRPMHGFKLDQLEGTAIPNKHHDVTRGTSCLLVVPVFTLACFTTFLAKFFSSRSGSVIVCVIVLVPVRFSPALSLSM